MDNTNEFKCICVDDEPLARQVIATLIENEPNLKLVGSFSNAVEAMEWLTNNDCHIVFSDINMPGVNGLNFGNALKSKNIPVIFTTAYSEFAVEAFDIEALDFLLKPISPERMNKASLKIEEYFHLRANLEKNDIEMNNGFIFVKSDSKLVKIAYSEITFVEAFADYVKIWCANNKRIVTLQTMKNMEMELPTDLFTRIHRSYIINVNLVEEIKPNLLKVAGTELPIGKNYKDKIMDFFNKKRI